MTVTISPIDANKSSFSLITESTIRVRENRGFQLDVTPILELLGSYDVGITVTTSREVLYILIQPYDNDLVMRIMRDIRRLPSSEHYGINGFASAGMVSL